MDDLTALDCRLVEGLVVDLGSLSTDAGWLGLGALKTAVSTLVAQLDFVGLVVHLGAILVRLELIGLLYTV